MNRCKRVEKLESRTTTDTVQHIDTDKLTTAEVDRFKAIESKLVANGGKYSALTDRELDDAVLILEKGEPNEIT